MCWATLLFVIVLTWYTDGVVISCSHLTSPCPLSVRGVWISEPHSQFDGTRRFSADQLIRGVLQLSTSLIHPAQMNMSVNFTVFEGVQVAGKGLIIAFLYLSPTGGNFKTNEVFV